jgi:hypothetical protein
MVQDYDVFDGMVWTKRQDAKHVIGLIMKHCLVSTCNKAVKVCDLPGSICCSFSTCLQSVQPCLSLGKTFKLSDIPLLSYSENKLFSQGYM